MNYSLNDDEAVITLLDSDDEELYNQSQNLLLDDAADTNSDRDSPVNRREHENDDTNQMRNYPTSLIATRNKMTTKYKYI